jgi:hypothetical protein
MNHRSSSSERVSMLESIRAPHTIAPHRLGQVGYGIILAAFVIALANSLLPEPNRVVGSLLQPLIFVGIGSLLYHIGQHVHALHENVIRMAMMDRDSPSEEVD